MGKFVALGNLLTYPANATSPLREEALQDGEIASTHLGVGLAKRDLVILAQMYQREFGRSVVNVLSANAYGPRDRIDSPHSHVIPATITKCFEQQELGVWGDGSPTRDFLFVEDIAEGLLLAAERLQSTEYVNVASETEVSIGGLVRFIAKLTGFGGQIIFDASKGGGDPRRGASIARAREPIGFAPRVSLEEGLRRTIAWYKQFREAL